MMCVLRGAFAVLPSGPAGFHSCCGTALPAALGYCWWWQEGALRVAALVLVLGLSSLPGTLSLKREMEELLPSQHLLSLGLKTTLIWHLMSKVKSFLAS